MSIWHRLAHALRKPEHRAVVQAGADLREQAEIVRADAERMVSMVNRESGIWHQDMVRGTYRVNRRVIRREHS